MHLDSIKPFIASVALSVAINELILKVEFGDDNRIKLCISFELMIIVAISRDVSIFNDFIQASLSKTHF